MEKIAINRLALVCAVTASFLLSSCDQKTPEIKETASIETTHANESENPSYQRSQEFKEYWYAGKAEITSYKIEQARYGELRDGHAVLVYVTEPFLLDKQVKADRGIGKTTSVLKLNATKKFLTGVYPYSIMNSTFYPVSDTKHALKVTTSVQEWCGHVYSQLNNRENFEVMSHSYFENEADQELVLEKSILENELWNKIRINPQKLPTGTHVVIPSFEYIRLSHNNIGGYNCIITLKKIDNTYRYNLVYPELERTLEITFAAEFPHVIEGWKETYKSGFGAKAQMLTSTARKINTINVPYWQRNQNKDVILRDSLGI